LAIKTGRHVLHERFRAVDGAFQPNDTFASDACSFQIVTGPNMSGKSTFLRQVALLHVMAQIGSFVPAGYCNIRICDAILSRLGNDDSIEDNLSTFGKEMSTMAMILSTLSTTTHALVIVDELGRGTSPEEGVGIAHAIAARIIRAKATCFFATHFKELPTTLSRYPNVVTYHLHAETNRAKSDFSMVFSHRVVPGVTPMAHYGLELVKAAKLPADVLLKAVEVSSELDRLEKDGKTRLAGSTVVKRRKALLEVRWRMLHLNGGVGDRRLMGHTLWVCHSQLRTNLRELATCDHLSPNEINERIQMLQNDLVYALAATLQKQEDVEGTTIEDAQGRCSVEAEVGAHGEEGEVEVLGEADDVTPVPEEDGGVGVDADGGDVAMDESGAGLALARAR